MIKIKKVMEFSFTTSILAIILGLMLIIWPAKTIITLTKVIGYIIVVIGAIQYIGELRHKVHSTILTTINWVVILIGALIVFFAADISLFIPFILGLFLVIHGIETMHKSFSNRGIIEDKWVKLFILGLITFLSGVLVIVLQTLIRDVSLMAIGCVLIYDGLSSLFVTRKVKVYRDNIIDVETEEIDEE